MPQVPIRRRSKLFNRDRRTSGRLPVSLLILAALIALFSLISPYRFPLNINPASVKVPAFTPTPTALPRPTDIHGGHIVFTCTRQEVNQICMINADGSDYRQITSGDANSYYPTMAPDGSRVVFSQSQYDYFDLNMFTLPIIAPAKGGDPALVRLTAYIGNAFSPSFSPDGKQIAFLNRISEGSSGLWMMARDGSNPHPIYTPPSDIVGAAWSPDGTSIALAMATPSDIAFQIFLIDIRKLNQAPRQISGELDAIGGSVGWSPDAQSLLIFAGPAAAREIYRLDVATKVATQLTFGGNNASPAYSPDGKYIVFNSLRNQGQADLYVMRADGHSMRRLTDNSEPDWQPYWGP